MSQQVPVPRHASRRSSKSPVGDDPLSPSSTRYGGGLGSHDTRLGQSGLPRDDAEGRSQEVPPKTLGVHNILNHPEPRLGMPEVSGNFGISPRPQEHGLPPSAPGSTPAQFATPRPFFPSQAASISLPGTPVGSLTPQGGLIPERNSPQTSYPFPPVRNARRMLSPNPHRATSLSLGSQSQDFETRQLASIPTATPAKRPYEGERPGEQRPQLPGLHHIPQGLQGPGPAPERHQLQAIAPSPGIPQASPVLIPGNASVRHPNITPQPPFHPGVPPNQPFQSTGPAHQGTSSWSDMMRRHGMGMGTEGQQAYMALPGSDTPIPVQVDYSQASKKADEKRQRNAVASTRHRRKKKILQEENSKQLQELRDERHQMELQIEALTRQRDFYRDDRNRLREVVAQTPSIQSHAAGPPSPSSARSSFAERSPLVGHHQVPSLSQGYTSEASSVERPTQRRRTDERPEFSIPIYGTPTSAHQSLPPGPPPMQGPPYGVPTRPPSAASSASGERLPPLRSMDVPLAGSGYGPGHAQEQDLRTGQWGPALPRQQETGWATTPRRPHDGPR